MARSYGPQSDPGSFVPTTNIWDVAQIYDTEVDSPDFKELIVRLYQNINNIALVLNTKDSGYYPLQEFLNSQLFFPNPALSSQTSQTPTYRQVFRTVVNVGPIAVVAASTTTISMPHNIVLTNGYSFTRIYGAASNTTINASAPGNMAFAPLPYASVGGTTYTIELQVDFQNINVILGSAAPSYNNCYVVLEYIKQ